jgi:hypothetical protein
MQANRFIVPTSGSLQLPVALAYHGCIQLGCENIINELWAHLPLMLLEYGSTWRPTDNQAELTSRE